MSRQFGDQSGAQSPEAMGVVRLNVELLAELAVDRLNDLPNRIEESLDLGGQLSLLIAPWQCS